ncbi:MAG: hypothetical protein FJX67_17280 [Alphaproteobacteria bacterium]|nr:hypothetical protein [Alphaproteobacteria bacterium]
MSLSPPTNASSYSRLWNPSPHHDAVVHAEELDPNYVAADPTSPPRDGGDLDFEDFLDIINPLQHLPIVSTIYRAVTGDTLSTGARFIGGALWAGPFGPLSVALSVVSSAAMATVEQATGRDPAGHLASLLGRTPREGDAARPTATTKIAGTTDIAAAAATAPAAGPVEASRATGETAAPETPATATMVPSSGVAALAALARDLRATPTPTPTSLAPTRITPETPIRGAMPEAGKSETGKSPAAGEPRAARHPNLPPAGTTSADWIAQAMERALEQYEKNAVARSTRAAPALSRSE